MTQFFFHKDRENLRALASLWRPDVPVSENKAYVERARELNADLETALVEHMSEDQADRARA
jgi:CPA2 family monovalent cation:H+ antiporter-2